jgi:hypothetical protein
LADALLDQFARVPGVTTRWGRRRPTRQELSKSQLKAFILDGSIVSLSHKQRGQEVEISCTIRVSLASYPQQSMKAFYTGGATMAVPAGDFDPKGAEPLYAELVAGAAEGARQHIVQAYLSNQ